MPSPSFLVNFTRMRHGESSRLNLVGASRFTAVVTWMEPSWVNRRTIFWGFFSLMIFLLLIQRD